MKNIDIFSHYLLQDAFDFQWDTLLKEKVENLLSNPKCLTHPEVPGGMSSLMINETMPHHWQELEPFIYWVVKKMPEIAKLWNLHPSRYEIMNSWFNCHPPGAMSTQHEHGSVDIVVSAYPRFPINGGKIQFKDPLEYHWHGYPVAGSRNTFWHTADIEENSVVIFPGWIKHRTEINTSTENRYVLTVNLKIR
jgi:uncharacterized protein (TIGR02466 family)